MFADISPKERKVLLLALGGVAVLLVVLAFLHKRAQAAAGLAAGGGPVSASASGAPPVQPAPDSFVDISSNTNSFNQSGFTTFSNFDMAPVPPGVAAMRANGHSLGLPPAVWGGARLGTPANPAPLPGQPTILGGPHIATRAFG